MLKLIATLNQLNDNAHVLEVLKNENIYGVRFNTGVKLHTDKKSALIRLKQLCDFYKKKLWVDLKGRQLRIISWADPLYEAIKLNHDVELLDDGFAQLILRNDGAYDISHIKNNEVFLRQKPNKAVGSGQSVNILPMANSKIRIKGYLTEDDKEYLEICKELGIGDIMASFVESHLDLQEIYNIHQDCAIICKIESKFGITSFTKEQFQHINKPISLMAARDDLSIELGPNISNELKLIISKDKNAICASKIFSSLKNNKYADMIDFHDLELMYIYGYRNFMLDDNISEFAFDKAIDAWKYFISNIILEEL